MPYSRFYNTEINLEFCLQELRENGVNDLSINEYEAAHRLCGLCKEYIDAYNESVDPEHDDRLEVDPDRFKSEESERSID